MTLSSKERYDIAAEITDLLIANIITEMEYTVLCDRLKKKP